MVKLYDPTAARRADAAAANPALATLAGKVVGFIDNAKPNFNFLVDDLAQQLVEHYGVATVIKRRKIRAGIPAPGAIMDELSTQCDAVITGSGD